MRITTIIAFLFFIGHTMAQVSESDKTMSQGSNNALQITIPSTDVKYVEKVWKDYSKDFDGKTKKDRKSDEWFTDDGELIAIGGANTVDVYAKAAASGDDVNFTAWFDLGGAYLSSGTHPDQYREAEKLLMRFALEVAIQKTQDKLDEEEKTFKKLEGTLRSLERDNDRYHKEIEDAKARIARAESDIQTNIKDQEKAKKEIEVQREVIEKVRTKLSELK